MAAMDVGPSNSFMSRMRGTLGSMNLGAPQQKGNLGDAGAAVGNALLRRKRMGAGNQPPQGPTNTGEMPPISPVSGPMMQPGIVRGPSFGFNPGMHTMPVNNGGMFGSSFLGGGPASMMDNPSPMMRPQPSGSLWNTYQGLSQQSDNPNRQMFY